MKNLRVQKNIVIYKNDLFYSAMPSAISLSAGEIIVAFRRAPERRLLGKAKVSHCDTNSQLVLVRSGDNGETWTSEPELIYAHPLGGSQDPCLFAVRDHTVICSSYGWCLTGADFKPENPGKHVRSGPYYFMGGYLLSSEDRCKTWNELPLPPRLESNQALDIFSKPYRSFNRGSMATGPDGTLFWSVTSHLSMPPAKGQIELLKSKDNGHSWDHISTVAVPKESFNESSLYVTPSGTILCFIRSFGMNDHSILARSFDSGESFQPWEDLGFRGHPHQAIKLPDNRVLLVYGYRHHPYGIRARILDPECENICDAKQIIVRDDGTNSDLGYPWATRMPNGNILIVYYFNDDGGTRFIAGTILG